jgi:TolA-binding protein
LRLVQGSAPKVLAVSVLVLMLATGLAACDRTSDTDQEIADLEQQVTELETQLQQTEDALEASEDANAELEQELAATKTELGTTQEQLERTQELLDATSTDLAQTQAELTDAQAQLAEVGELVLADGTYVGQVLGAKSNPYPVIIFDSGGAWRVAQVADGATITAGGDEYTLSQFGKLLDSSDPDDIELVNGNYQVIVKKGLATSIRKSKG